jgi:DNA polymerase III delta subunit
LVSGVDGFNDKRPFDSPFGLAQGEPSTKKNFLGAQLFKNPKILFGFSFLGHFNSMLYILLGEDRLGKDQRLAEFKNKFCSKPDALLFDYEVLYGSNLDPADLKKSLLSLPSIAATRLIILKAVHKLSSHNKELILEFVNQDSDRACLVLDVDDADLKNAFMSKLLAKAKVEEFASRKKFNVFDMTRAMSARNPVEALKILDQLYAEGNHPLLIMGGLVWFWGRSKVSLPAARFKKGLLLLQEADMNIKRTRLEPEYALEVLVTKLCSLIAG